MLQQQQQPAQPYLDDKYRVFLFTIINKPKIYRNKAP